VTELGSVFSVQGQTHDQILTHIKQKQRPLCLSFRDKQGAEVGVHHVPCCRPTWDPHPTPPCDGWRRYDRRVADPAPTVKML
jgi:hypothetical protein